MRTPAMAGRVEVPVSDVLVPRLPPVCCMTGAPADGYASIDVTRSIGLAWVLLAFGPPGWLLLAALWRRFAVRYVAKIPMSEASFDRMHLLRVRRLWCGWLGFIGLGATLALRWYPPLALLVGALSVFGLAVSLWSHWKLPWTYPSMRADVRGRKVSLLGVHPDFVAAVQRRMPTARTSLNL